MHRLAAVPAILLIAGLAGCGGSGPFNPGEDPDLLYQETFDSIADGPLPSDWEVHTQTNATVDAPADWQILSHRLHQASNIFAPDGTGLSYSPDYEGTLAVVGDTSWVSISIRADVIPRDDDGIGIVWRWSEGAPDPGGDFYRLLMVEDTASGGPLLRVDKRVGGVWTVIDTSTSPDYNGYDENRRYVIEIDMVIDEFTVKLDGAIQFEFTDSSLTRGKIGFFCFGEQGADFDNIRVYRRGP
jgi:hypothetical protein